MHPDFCDPFDAELAHRGPPGVFLLDREGLLRFDPEWTRDAWTRASQPLDATWRWVLLRDHGTGFVQLVLATSAGLLTAHPRADVRSYPDHDSAQAARAAFGSPPVTREPW